MNSQKEGSPYQIQTFVFLDLETNGFDDKPNILELSMIAVSRNDLLYMQENHLHINGKPPPLPRVLHKYTRLYYPRKLIYPHVEEITGLSNYNLHHLPSFQIDSANEINLFLKFFPSPVCLVAHNGIAFDFPILKAELLGVNSDGMNGIVCTDSLLFVRNFEKEDIKCIIELAENFQDSDFENIPQTTHENGNSSSLDIPDTSEVIDGGPSLSIDLTKFSSDVINNMYKTPKKVIPSTSFASPPNLQKNGITLRKDLTPEHNINHNELENLNGHHNPKAKRALYHDEDLTAKKMKKPFSQPNLFHRIFGYDYEAHRAESDTTALLQICAFHGQEFISWADQNFTPFQSIKPRWATRRTFTL